MLGFISTLVEPAMFFGMGFLAAALAALAFSPIIHGRAVRLTKRRSDATIPPSFTEMQVEKDGMRARFAIATRQLETAIHLLKGKLVAHTADLHRKQWAITRLKMALEERSTLVNALEARDGVFSAREKALVDEILTLREERHRLMEMTLGNGRDQYVKLVPVLERETP